MDNEWLQARDSAFGGCRLKFAEFVERLGSAMEDIGAFEWGERWKDSADFILFGTSYRLCHEFDLESFKTMIRLLAKDLDGDEKYRVRGSIEMDQSGNLRARERKTGRGRFTTTRPTCSKHY